MNRWFLSSQDNVAEFSLVGGGKAKNLAVLCQKKIQVPPWFCVSAEAFDAFLKINNWESLKPTGDLKKFSEDLEKQFVSGKLPEQFREMLLEKLRALNLTDCFVAVRSSGLDEDSADHSFAGQFSTFLFQKSIDQIEESLKKCWASAYSERALAYRIEKKLPTSGIRMGVVIQQMVNADVAGVAFSRNPIKQLDRDSVVVSSVYGLGEGLVSGELDADHFLYSRSEKKIKSELVEKTEAFRQAAEGGIIKVSVEAALQKTASLSDAQVSEVAELTIHLENQIGSPQDCEWAFEGGKLFCLQTRPITNLPPEAFYNEALNGNKPILWDNSNIIESYSGVTSPLTFSFASFAYRQVYVQFCEMMGVPQKLVIESEGVFRNMLGLIRGRIYYNLVNWYKLVLLLPGSSQNKGFMETMMGVKEGLHPALGSIFEFTKNPPEYALPKKIYLHLKTVWRYLNLNSIVGGFQKEFSSVYETARKKPFRRMSLNELADLYLDLEIKILRRWHAPIVNDYLCMLFFGVIKKLTETWIAKDEEGAHLQNDLLCGQGDLESTEPTKYLMRFAAWVDGTGQESIRQWLLTTDAKIVWDEVMHQKSPSLDFNDRLLKFLDLYGFRCVDELKLESTDLHDDPSFAIQALTSYVKMKTYSIEAMEERERAILHKAENTVNERLTGVKRYFYKWVIGQTRRVVKNRENLRFARTKIFGVVRQIFRAIGHHFVALKVIRAPDDIFFLTVDEILGFIEGRSVTDSLDKIVEIRRTEFSLYAETEDPPERFLSTGAAAYFARYSNLCVENDLLAKHQVVNLDPMTLTGTPCCPGVIEGIVRVVKNIKDAENLDGEILVTGRTDPGWVPLYPSCSGLLIERGSLLSHSAVVARELGLPTIVGVQGGLMTRLQTGMRVRVDAGRGEIKILETP